MKIAKKIDSERIRVDINKEEACWLANSLNEVLHGIHDVETDKVLLIPKLEAREFHSRFQALYKEQPWDEDKATIILQKNDFILFRRAMIAVMRDFNKYNEYGTRLGVEFEEYLNLLSDINSILEES